MGAHYFLGSRLIGTSSKPPMWADNEPSTSCVFFCDTCGEVWGRAVNDQLPRWTFQVRACIKHGSGSFIAPWANKFEELPPEVLAYEFLIRLEKYERENPNAIQRPSGV